MAMYWKNVDGTASGVIPGADEGIHDYGIGEEPGEPGEPGDVRDPADLLNDEYKKTCIKRAQESRRMADSKCVDAMCMICDGMKLVYEQMNGLKMFRCGEEFVKLAAEMTAMGDSIAKIRTSMESAPRFTGWGAV